ncbi:hypothetical protein Tco_1013557 [Tanacetum coccineum]
MRNIKMTMPKMQLNSKFVNNMLPECGRFVTALKLKRGLKTSNYDQLYAYLKQHEAHANENKMMLEKYTQHAIDPLAFVSNVSPQQYPSQSSAIPQSAYVSPVTYQPQFANNTQPDLGLTPTDDLIENLTKIDKMLIMQAQDNGVVLDEEQLLFIAANQCDAFNSDVDEAPTAQTMFIANLSSADLIYDDAGPSYDSDILSEVQDHDNFIDSVVSSNGTRVMQTKPFYDEKKKVAIGYKNPLYLTRAMQVQSALTNYAPAVVHDSEDNLELAERTRIGILEKMKSPM